MNVSQQPIKIRIGDAVCCGCILLYSVLIVKGVLRTARLQTKFQCCHQVFRSCITVNQHG